MLSIDSNLERHRAVSAAIARLSCYNRVGVSVIVSVVVEVGFSM